MIGGRILKLPRGHTLEGNCENRAYMVMLHKQLDCNVLHEYAAKLR